MLRALRFLGLLVIHVVTALIATAIVETTFWKVVPAHSVVAVLWKEWILSIVCAASIGFSVGRAWHSDVVKWTWIPTSVWFALRFIVAVGSGATWLQFSGSGCANGSRSPGCVNFTLFTIPFVRGVSYSLGAYVSSLVRPADKSGASASPPSTAA
jgi:hypothetical protein